MKFSAASSSSRPLLRRGKLCRLHYAALAAACTLSACAPRRPGEAHLRAGVRRLRQALRRESHADPDPGQRSTLGKAVKLLEKARTHLPASASVHVNLGVAYWRLERYDEAAVALGRGAELASDDPRPLELAGHMYDQMGQWGEARAAFDAANQRQTYSPRILTAMGVVEHHAGQFALAEAYFQQALKLQPEFAPALYNYAILHRDHYGDDQMALALFGRFRAVAAVRPLPSTAPLRAREAMQTRLREAEAYLTPQPEPAAPESTEPPSPIPAPPVDQAEQPPPAEPGIPPEAVPSREAQNAPPAPNEGAGPRPTGHAIQVWGRGLAAQQAGDLGKAESFYRQSLKLDPNLLSAAYNLGLVCRARGDLPAARDAFLKAVAIDADMGGAHYMLGLVYRDLKRHDQAIQHLDRVLAGDSQSARAHLVLGLIYRDDGRSELASTHFEHFLRLAPDDPHAATVKEWMKGKEEDRRPPIPR